MIIRKSVVVEAGNMKAIKNYLISEEDISTFFETNKHFLLVGWKTLELEFLEFTQPAELLAEGEVKIGIDSQVTINGNTLVYKFAEYNDKQVKLYIEVSK